MFLLWHIENFFFSENFLYSLLFYKPLCSDWYSIRSCFFLVFILHYLARASLYDESSEDFKIFWKQGPPFPAIDKSAQWSFNGPSTCQPQFTLPMPLRGFYEVLCHLWHHKGQVPLVGCLNTSLRKVVHATAGWIYLISRDAFKTEWENHNMKWKLPEHCSLVCISCFLGKCAVILANVDLSWRCLKIFASQMFVACISQNVPLQ